MKMTKECEDKLLSDLALFKEDPTIIKIEYDENGKRRIHRREKT